MHKVNKKLFFFLLKGLKKSYPQLVSNSHHVFDIWCTTLVNTMHMYNLERIQINWQDSQLFRPPIYYYDIGLSIMLCSKPKFEYILPRRQYWKTLHRLTNKLTPLSIIVVRFRALFEPLGTKLSWCSTGYSAPMMPKHASLSDSCTSDRCWNKIK